MPFPGVADTPMVRYADVRVRDGAQRATGFSPLGFVTRATRCHRQRDFYILPGDLLQPLLPESCEFCRKKLLRTPPGLSGATLEGLAGA